MDEPTELWRQAVREGFLEEMALPQWNLEGEIVAILAKGCIPQ